MDASDDESFLGDDTFFASEEEGSIDYYAILNVARDANIDEINKAYKHRCLIFHPDRHTNEDDKKEAAKTFVLLRKAHDTLVDPRMRSVYDAVGIKGLDMQSNWQLVERSNNPENIRKEYEFLKNLHDHEIMLQRVHPASTFALKVSACGLFQEDPLDRYGPQLLGMSISQSVDCAMTSSDKVSLVGRARTFNGRGDGNLSVSWKRDVPGGWHLEASHAISPDAIGVSAKVQKLLSPRAAFIIQPSVQYLPLYSQLNPSVMLVYTLQLQPNWQGTLALNYGLQGSSLTTSIVHSELNHPKFIANLTLSPVNTNLRVAYNKRYAHNDLQYETACSVGLFGVAPSAGFERRLSRYSKVGASLSFSFPACLLQASFRLKTSLSNYEVKLVLCDNQEYVARSTVFGLLLPLIAIGSLKAIFRKPLARLMKVFEDRVDDEQVNERRKEESQRVIHIMRNSAERIAKEEEKRGVW
uniref:J domain-containing protein n=1 Tax=Ditylenchus dipsaci TaxID=166011 RepID=A0A915E1D3_9BILA